ncbi:MAG: alcohol dehydrogenase catalytic domain-containing protein, partial [Planctomycetes bacterium]|nr:alcohol dehydrogenase catalytic domain-containing protein [Planctomycetota bacterium]
MKAVIKKDYGPYTLEYADFPKPEAGDDDVVFKVKAAAICGSDLGLYYDTVEGKTVDYPIVIGHEFAGEISEVGKNVTRWKVGDRVVSDNSGYVCGTCHACGSGQYLFCANRKGMGNDMDGGFAEYVKIPGQVLQAFPNCLYRIPDNASYESAAMMDPCCNGYKAVIQEGGLLPGETVVVFGVGALGLFSVIAAKNGGAGKIII